MTRATVFTGYFNLRIIPRNDQLIPDDVTTCVIGDLHGNAMKLIFCLLTSRLLKISQEIYTQLCQAYHEVNYDIFLSLLRRLKCTSARKNRKLILIGDTLCDRGNSDYMTLLVYEWMSMQGVDFSIIFSNHDREFVRYGLNGFNLPSRGVGISQDQSISFDYRVIDATKKRHVKNIFKNIYLPRLKLLEYLPNTNNSLQPFLLTHAPCDDKTLINLAVLMREQMDDVSTIDKAVHVCNESFSKNLQSCTDNQLIYNFIWDRHEHRGDIPRSFINVYGHVGEIKSKNEATWIGLDTDLGRSELRMGLDYEQDERAEISTLEDTGHELSDPMGAALAKLYPFKTRKLKLFLIRK
tara:strand:+ start:80803 stop:81858 length:1056 start_codon:yes stop_codon:yes gene_type:complete